MRHTPLALAFLTVPVAAQAAWTTPVLVPNIGSTISDTSPCLSSDGLTMYFASSRINKDWELFETTRATTTSAWGTPTVVAATSDPNGTESDPFVTADGLELYFYSTRTGGQGGSDIMRCTRASTAVPFGAPAFVTELNSPDADGSPSLTEDGLTIFILSSRAGSPAPPNAAIWTATRPNTTSPFSTPTLVTELATTNANRGPEISPDGLELYWMQYSSASRASQIMLARRTSTSRPFKAPEVVQELSTNPRIDGPTVDRARNRMFVPMFNSTSGALGFQIHETRFEGLTVAGHISSTSSMDVRYRDSAAAGLPYIGFFSLGNGPTQLFGRTIPLTLGPIFQVTAGGFPTVTTGFVGALDANGEALGTITNPNGALTGARLWTGWITIDPNAPLSLGLISNSIEVEFQ